MFATISKRCFQQRTRQIFVRSFLSEAYKLSEAWNTRLNSPILQKINLDSFYYELEQKFNNQKTTSAIDVDIYANKVIDDNYIDEVGDLLNKLRRTAEATNILDSTGHAYVRTLLDCNQIEQLIQVLDNRIEYGVFLDDYTMNLIMDRLLKGGKYKEAARIVTIHMLQEDFSNPISRALSLFACYKYLQNPEIFDDLQPPVVPEVTGKKKKPEEIKVRVKFLRNPYFDDHFDIRDSQHLIGKTLYYIGRELKDQMSVNIQLLGLTLYQKYDAASKLLDSTKNTEIYKEVLEKISDSIAKVPEEQQSNEAYAAFKSAIEKINASHKIIEFDLEKNITQMCNSAVAEHESQQIEAQKQLYQTWIGIREKRLNEEIERLNRVERLKNVQKLSEEMEAEERKLWFFENEDAIDLQIEGKKVYYPKRWFGNKKKPRAADENYIPPEV